MPDETVPNNVGNIKEENRMTKIKKTLSMLVCICICLVTVVSALLMGGVRIANAADKNSELWLLADVNYALLNGKRVKLGENTDLSPYQNDTGTMYLPISIVAEYSNAAYSYDGTDCVVKLSDGSEVKLTVGSPSWTRNGEPMTDFLIPVKVQGDMPFISILMANDIFGTYNYYDSVMGLLIFGKKPISGYSTSYSSIKSQINTLCSMIMDRPSGEQVYNDIEANIGVSEHPRLLIDQKGFDDLRLVYNFQGTNAYKVKHQQGIIAQVTSGSNAFDASFIVNENGEVEWKDEEARIAVRQPHYLYDENGNRLVGRKSYTYIDSETGEEITLTLDETKSSPYGDGYDLGGRSNVEIFTKRLRNMAFAWQMTGDDKYADAFYLLAKELDKWEHWGEGHFLNVADGSYAYAIGFDWIYHAFDDEPEKQVELADILYRKGVMKGYYSVKYDSLAAYQSDMHVSKVVGNGGMRTTNRTNNWQSVCGAGMIVSALAICEYDAYRENSLYVIEGYMKTIDKCLLQYAPDGAYPESPGYWSYGTNTLMNTVAAFEVSCGTSYGYKDIVGLHESYYYAAGIADSDYVSWNYHDAGRGKIDCSYFYFAAKEFGDSNLAAFRDEMIFKRNYSMTLMDVLFYDYSLDLSRVSMPLDNNFRGIYTATFRSSWDSGATFTGLHAGPTHLDHGDFDTGNFVLTMGGVEWCIDPGTEDYNTSGFWSSGEGSTRYRLYRKSLEGHSTVIIHSSELVHGQKYVSSTGSFPTINTFYTDENGGYAITNMKGQYGSTCTSAYRGVLMTNSRETVILQDEISFSSPTSLTWVLNLAGYIRIIDEGKTIITHTWKNGEKITLRVTLLSEDDSLKFRKLGTYETVLSNTITKENSGRYGTCNPEQRVVIEANNVTDFNVGVVFELIEDERQVVGYSKVPMEEWTTCTDEWLDEANEGILNPDDEPKPTYKYGVDFFLYAVRSFESAGNDYKKYADIINETSVYLTDYDPNNKTIQKLVGEYKLYVAKYNLEVERIIEKANNSFMEAGTDYKKYAEIINESIGYLDAFTPEDKKAETLLNEYKAYVELYNAELARINEEFMRIFFGNVPTSDPF